MISFVPEIKKKPYSYLEVVLFYENTQTFL